MESKSQAYKTSTNLHSLLEFHNILYICKGSKLFMCSFLIVIPQVDITVPIITPPLHF